MIDGSSQLYLWIGLVGSVLGTIAFLPLAVKFLKKIKSYITAPNYVVVGPTAAGKSSLLEYLKKRVPQQSHVATKGSKQIRWVRYNLRSGGTAIFHATKIVEHGGEFTDGLKITLSKLNPTSLIVVFDISRYSMDYDNYKAEAQGVVYQITNSLNDYFTDSDEHRRSLKFVLIILNKYDLISDVDQGVIIKKFKEQYKDFINYLGKLGLSHDVILCSLVGSQFMAPLDGGLHTMIKVSKGDV